MDSPWRAASPERGCTKATYPTGRAIATPVGTIARSPGARLTSTVVSRSAPASPGWAYDGSGRSGSRRRTRISRSGVGGTSPDPTGSRRDHQWKDSAREPHSRLHRATRRPAALVGAGHDAGGDALAG